jgi:hypothetical protein
MGTPAGEIHNKAAPALAGTSTEIVSRFQNNAGHREKNLSSA